MKLVRAVFVLAVFSPATAQELRDIEYRSAADNSMQRAMFHDPKSDKPVPLVVALHTWSGGYRQQHHKPIREWCMKKGWAYIHPDFRGPARRPEGPSIMRAPRRPTSSDAIPCSRTISPNRRSGFGSMAWVAASK